MVIRMRKALFIVISFLAAGLTSFAQMAPGADFDNGMEKLFNVTPVFSATMVTAITGPNGPMTVKSKMSFDHENSRTEMNMADVSGENLPPNAAARMQAMGMDKVVTITPADKKNVYLIYPNLHSYVAMPVPGNSATNSYKVEKTKLGTDTVDGHPCVKNKVVVAVNGEPHDFTAWNATDLNNFPIQIAMDQQGLNVTITFHDVSFDKLSSSLFQPPADYKEYSSMQDLMQSVITSHGGAGPGTPVPSAGPNP